VLVVLQLTVERPVELADSPQNRPLPQVPSVLAYGG
jgi:hypothetical protein